jgi:hypothetical protein
VPSRAAAEDEALRLCAVVGQYPGTTLEAIVEGCLQGFSDQEVELLAQMSAAAHRPLNWNVLTIAAGQEERTARQLLPSRRAREVGGRVVALTMPVFADNNMSLATFCALWLIPGWQEILALPAAEKTARLLDPAVRAEMLRSAKGTVFDRSGDRDRIHRVDRSGLQRQPEMVSPAEGPPRRRTPRSDRSAPLRYWREIGGRHG